MAGAGAGEAHDGVADAANDRHQEHGVRDQKERKELKIATNSQAQNPYFSTHMVVYPEETSLNFGAALATLPTASLLSRRSNRKISFRQTRSTNFMTQYPASTFFRDDVRFVQAFCRAFLASKAPRIPTT